MERINKRYNKLALMIAACLSAPTALAANKENLPSGETEVESVTVHGHADKHQAGHDKVYEEDMSSLYRDKDQIELFRGTSAADLFKGMAGVGIGDARNSGGIDPNIRGIQGQGRVPVTIDGAENGVTVWRGYYGANNRSYIDPMLISSIRVEKGASLTRGFQSSVGGGIALKTLEADDVLKPGRKIGADIRLEAGNNMAKERLPDMSVIGKEWPYLSDDGRAGLRAKTYVLPGKQKNNSFGHDQAGRIAVAGKSDWGELVAAYAYRYHGNYYAGKGGRDHYAKLYFGGGVRGPGFSSPNATTLDNMFASGGEVMNTSLDNRSFLVKGTLKPTENQAIRLGYRYLDSRYGEIMPSRNTGLLKDGQFTMPQWPLSRIRMGTYTLDYHWKPGNRWIDLEAGIWKNQARMDLHNSGGNVYDFAYVKNHKDVRDDKSTREVVAGSFIKSLDNRWGVQFSNKMRLLDKLNLTVGGSFQHEKLGSPDEDWKVLAGYELPFASVPRQGRRNEYQGHFNFDWQPTERLSINAGARYNHYDVIDDLVNNALSKVTSLQSIFEDGLRRDVERNGSGESRNMLESHNLSMKRNLSDEDLSFAENALAGETAYGIPYNRPENINQEEKAEYLRQGASEAQANEWAYRETNSSNGSHPIYYLPRDEYGKISRADNPFLNGKAKELGIVVPYQFVASGADKTQHMERIDSITDGVYPRYAELARLVYSDEYTLRQESLRPGSTGTGTQELAAMKARIIENRKQMAALEHSGWKQKRVEKRKGHAWSPIFSISYRLTDNIRLYGRWAQNTRMPSIFESTSGFSSSAQGYKRKPEVGTNLEFGYVHNLRDILPGKAESADIKLAYYRNTIRNAIDRGDNLEFIQRDKWSTSGLELSGRYDNGRFFAEAGANYVLNNRVCDSNEAALVDVYYGKSPLCVEGGFPGGYMYNMALPKYTFNVLLGGRFFDRKLEMGSRLTFHTGYKRSKEAEDYVKKYLDGSRSTDIAALNGSVPWYAATIIDAYVKYNFKNDLSIEFTGSNLTNRYYFDPLARANMPAPGRTLRFSLSKKF
ncbi:MAG: TonB-dependent receptor [Neisseria sp.]|uniref:TonB-dependent receptor domain-containing protein n=1 Tax=Neisseria sp. TaxID=192066 RepID=UPI0026DCAF62|nr:TonB-dependent receptor [Neisseria sp.]MDO4640867.1 TonB-dependent receptor [Neisseria sp.]